MLPRPPRLTSWIPTSSRLGAVNRFCQADTSWSKYKVGGARGISMSRPSDTRSDPNRLAAILDSTIEGVYSNDLQGRCTFINQAAARMLGYTPDEVLGKSMHELIHHSHADTSPYPLQECPMFQACRTGHVNRSDDEVFWRR